MGARGKDAASMAGMRAPPAASKGRGEQPPRNPVVKKEGGEGPPSAPKTESSCKRIAV